MPLKVLDLFSGIGGFSLGLESTGYFETVAFCEKDEFCKKVLQKHWSQLKIYDDVRSLYDTKIQADVVTGGFPCQSFSQVGLQKGRTDDRWLWNEMFDVIKQVKPRWVIGENVQGIINIEEGMVLRQVQNDLEGEGFKVQCFIIPASGIGAWHQRKRIWILASNPNNARCKDRTEQHRGESAQKKKRVNSTSRSSFISDTNNNGSHRSKGNETLESSDKQEDRLFIRDDKNVPNSKSRRYRGGSSQGCENKEWTFLPREQEGGEMGSKTKRCSNVSDTSGKRYKGHNFKQIKHDEKFRQSTSSNDAKRETWWQTESRICGVPPGVSYGVDRDRAKRIKALGNSIVPQIARQIGLAIMEAEDDN
jgi:DNA (cytosine-5)-methyltransferase 1